MRPGLLAGADRSRERLIAAIGVTGKNLAQSLVERWCRGQDVLSRTPVEGLGRIGEYLIDPAPAHE